jgi:hypothetical protein
MNRISGRVIGHSERSEESQNGFKSAAIRKH